MTSYKVLFRSIKSSSLGIMSENRVLFCKIIEHNLVSLADWSDSKQTVHRLEWYTLRLWNEEVDERHGKDHHAGEEEINAELIHRDEHLRCEPRDDEVPSKLQVSFRLSLERSLGQISWLRSTNEDTEKHWCNAAGGKECAWIIPRITYQNQFEAAALA